MKSQFSDALALLSSLIRIPSFSKEESATADLIGSFLSDKGIKFKRLKNNIVAKNKNFDATRMTVVLNSHHDTVKVGDGWTRDPFGAEVDKDRLYGRGSNDAGGALVALISAFVHFYNTDLPYNLVLIASAEEENFGANGLSYVLNNIDFKPDFAIVGEPTELDVAISEMGLLVIDAEVQGRSGHVARDTAINPIYIACQDIQWINDYRFDRISDHLGETRINVTQINAGNQHNVVPDKCSYVIDVRVNELYSHEEIIELLENRCLGTFVPRSLKWRASFTPVDHPVVQRCDQIGLRRIGSKTLSDQVHFSCPSIKIGPGKSERSHTADEYIFTSELEDGIRTYIKILNGINF